MDQKNTTPPKWALAGAGALAVVQLVALPFIPEGWPLALDFVAVAGAARLAWRRWPY